MNSFELLTQAAVKTHQAWRSPTWEEKTQLGEQLKLYNMLLVFMMKAKTKSIMMPVTRDKFIEMYRQVHSRDGSAEEEAMWQRFVRDAHKFDMVAVVDSEPAEWGEHGL